MEVVITFPAVLYSYETSDLRIREERRLMVFKNRIRGEYFGPVGMRMEELLKSLYRVQGD